MDEWDSRSVTTRKGETKRSWTDERKCNALYAYFFRDYLGSVETAPAYTFSWERNQIAVECWRVLYEDEAEEDWLSITENQIRITAHQINAGKSTFSKKNPRLLEAIRITVQKVLLDPSSRPSRWIFPRHYEQYLEANPAKPAPLPAAHPELVSLTNATRRLPPQKIPEKVQDNFEQIPRGDVTKIKLNAKDLLYLEASDGQVWRIEVRQGTPSFTQDTPRPERLEVADLDEEDNERAKKRKAKHDELDEGWVPSKREEREALQS